MPRQPFSTPTVSCPSSHSRRQTARITAFRPGQSPPPVSIPTRIGGESSNARREASREPSV